MSGAVILQNSIPLVASGGPDIEAMNIIPAPALGDAFRSARA